MKFIQLLVISTLFTIFLVGCQSTGDTKPADSSPKVSITQTEQYGDLSGRWKSKVDSRWGGGLDIYINRNEGGSAFKGKLAFWQSGCPWKAPFDGTIFESGEIVLKSNPGGKCGKVVINGTFIDDRFSGTYTAEFPDNGTVSLK